MNKRILAVIACALLLATFTQHANSEETCFGEFPNLFSDICWDCSFPIKLFGGPIINVDSQEDVATDAPNLCACKGPGGLPKPGLLTSFWEFSRQVEVTRTPYCMVSLGTKMNLGINSQMRGSVTPGNITNGGRIPKQVFRHSHWYINPAMGLMEIALDSKCLEPKGFDIAYLSEVDPTHGDGTLERILSPESYMFGNIVALLACAGDCVSSTIGFGSNVLYWCAGCNGTIFPMTGYLDNTYGGIQASSLLAQRTAAKMHRMMTQTSSAGKKGMCGGGGFPQINMDKTQYKYSMIYPAAQSSPAGANTFSGTPINIGGPGASATNNTESKAARNSSAGRCCQPFGRSTMLWGSGREIPTPAAQDFSYSIFRKRDCCQ